MLQQGKIGQTLVGSIVIHLWKGIQILLFVITVEKSQREEQREPIGWEVR